MDLQKIILQIAANQTPEFTKRAEELKKTFKREIAYMYHNVKNKSLENLLTDHLKSDNTDNISRFIHNLVDSKSMIQNTQVTIKKYEALYKELFNEDYVYNEEDIYNHLPEGSKKAGLSYKNV